MLLRAVTVLCIALTLMISSTRAVRAGSTQSDQLWLVASDIHLNQYDRSPEPTLFGSDTNIALFESALAAMKRDIPDPAVVVLPGDFFVHNFTRWTRRSGEGRSVEDAGIETMRTIAGAFDRAFPRAQFAIVLGNNDAPCGDYRSDENDRYLTAIAHIWAPLVDRHGAAPGFAASFARSGYYTATLPVHGLRLVALNTVLFSSQFKGSCGGDGANAAANELTWLHATLRASPNGVRNVVMMHIPPGFDAFTTETTHGYVPWSFLKTSYNEGLLDALSAPADHVAYAIAGHMHRFDFRLAGNVPILVFGSISPVYRNNPAFYGVHVAANGSLSDIDTYAFDEWTQTWEPARSFDRTWGVDRIDAATLTTLHARLENDAAMRTRWDRASSGWPSNPAIMWSLWGRFWRIPWCAQTVLTSGFAACAGIEHRVVLFRSALIAVLVVVCGLFALVLVRVVRRRRVRRA